MSGDLDETPAVDPTDAYLRHRMVRVVCGAASTTAAKATDILQYLGIDPKDGSHG